MVKFCVPFTVSNKLMGFLYWILYSIIIRENRKLNFWSVLLVMTFDLFTCHLERINGKFPFCNFIWFYLRFYVMEFPKSWRQQTWWLECSRVNKQTIFRCWGSVLSRGKIKKENMMRVRKKDNERMSDKRRGKERKSYCHERETHQHWYTIQKSLETYLMILVYH